MFLLPVLFWRERIQLVKIEHDHAMMAPSWITTSNISLNAAETFKFMNSSTKIRCPVLLIGSIP